MLVVMLIVVVLIGVAYADFCLVSNTAHFGICYGKVAEAAVEGVEDVVPPAVFEATVAGENQVIPRSLDRADAEANGTAARPPRVPAPAWLLLDLEPVLEPHEHVAGARR